MLRRLLLVLACSIGVVACNDSSGPSAAASSGGSGAPSTGGAGGGASPGAGGSPSGSGGSPTTGGNGGTTTAGSGGAAGAGGAVGSSAGGAAGSPDAPGVEARLLYSGAVKRNSIEISAPILPRTSVIYAPFPATLDGEKEMAHEASLLFDKLLVDCAPLYPTITLDPAAAGLTPEQLGVNYDQVGLCAYLQYSAKPYWIPKLVGDVDICGTEMGPDWHLISEADLAVMTDADFQAVADVWDHYAVSGQGLPFYFTSLWIWVRTNDGTIASATIAPGAGASRITPLGVSPTSTGHYEGSLALRCIRGTSAP